MQHKSLPTSSVHGQKTEEKVWQTEYGGFSCPLAMSTDGVNTQPNYCPQNTLFSWQKVPKHNNGIDSQAR